MFGQKCFGAHRVKEKRAELNKSATISIFIKCVKCNFHGIPETKPSDDESRHMYSFCGVREIFWQPEKILEISRWNYFSLDYCCASPMSIQRHSLAIIIMAPSIPCHISLAFVSYLICSLCYSARTPHPLSLSSILFHSFFLSSFLSRKSAAPRLCCYR